MPLSPAQREYVITTAVDLLRHPRRERLIQILEQRLEHGDYSDEEERDLDRMAHALASAIDRQLAREDP